jgi:hypothetical protein
MSNGVDPNTNFGRSDGVSLREYFEMALKDFREQSREDSKDLKEAFNEKFKAQDKALGLATKILEKRLENMNEFRQALTDQAASFITREIYESRHDILQRQVDDLRLKGAELDGKASQKSLQATNVMAMIALIMSVAAFVIEYVLK